MYKADNFVSLNNIKQAAMTGVEKEQLVERVEQALDNIRPHLAIDGGNIEVVNITEDKIVQIKWLGNCEACSMSVMTMRAGVEETLRSHVPEVSGVEALNGVHIA
jgi:Fe-S cluster biogenesis protein NfuA